jgi:hypothetical protein
MIPLLDLTDFGVNIPLGCSPFPGLPNRELPYRHDRVTKRTQKTLQEDVGDRECQLMGSRLDTLCPRDVRNHHVTGSCSQATAPHVTTPSR